MPSIIDAPSSTKIRRCSVRRTLKYQSLVLRDDVGVRDAEDFSHQFFLPYNAADVTAMACVLLPW